MTNTTMTRQRVLTLEAALCHTDERHADLAPTVTCYDGVLRARVLRQMLRDRQVHPESWLMRRTGTPSGTPSERAEELAALHEMRTVLTEAIARADTRIAELQQNT